MFIHSIKEETNCVTLTKHYDPCNIKNVLWKKQTTQEFLDL